MSLAQGYIFAVAPAAIGAALGIGLIAAARPRGPASADALGRVLILAAIPTSAVVFALVATFVAAHTDEAARLPLGALGGAALLQGGIQGHLGASALKRGMATQEALVRALLPIAACEVLTIAALVWVFSVAAPGPTL